MGVFRTIGKAVKPLVNAPKWMGYRDLKATTKNVGRFAKLLLKPQRSERQETFEEAFARYDLDEKTLASRAAGLKRNAIVYVIVAALVFAYTVFLFFSGYHRASFVGILISILALSFAYREHFRYMMIKQRRLGCGFADWLKFCFKRAKS